MDHLDSIVCGFMESSIGLKRVINTTNNLPSSLIQVTVLECYFIHYIRSLYNIAVAEYDAAFSSISSVSTMFHFREAL